MENNIFIPKGVLRKKNKVKRKNIPQNIFAGNEHSTPDKIVIYYKDTINLKLVDETIKFRFKKFKEGITTIEKDIMELRLQKEEKTTTWERHFMEKKIQEKLIFIDSIINDTALNNYIDQTKDIITKYNETKDITLAELYLNIAENYIFIEKIKKLDKKILCKGCNYDLLYMVEDQDGYIVCPECKTLNASLKPNKYIKDTENFNFNYEEDINNFIKIIDKFEGKNTICIHEELYEELDNYFVDKGMQKGEYYRNLPPLDNGKKEGTSRKKLWMALEKLGYNQYYDETSYISNIYWGWKIPDLSLYRAQIIKDYQNTQFVWNNIKSEYKRSASLGTQYRLYVHLLAVGYPHCERDDFKIQDMVESLRLHNHAWYRMCEATNVKFFEVSS